MYVRDHKLWGHWHKPSPNVTPGTVITPRFIVMHYTAGWSGAKTRDYFLSKVSKVSAHLVVDRSGEVWQVVPFNQRAWHAGPSSKGSYTDLNSHSIGIEIDNPGFLRVSANGTYRTSNGSAVPASQLDGYELEELSHPRLGSGTYAWAYYTQPQLEALDAIVTTLLEAYPTIEDIVSHEEIDTRGWKTDPGPLFPMRRFLKLLDDRSNAVAVTGGKPMKVVASSLNVRGGPGTNFDTMDFGPLANDTRVMGIEQSGAWWRIETSAGDRGWVHGIYVRAV